MIRHVVVCSHCLSNVFLIFPVTKFIRIGIADKNDNPPYFDKALYEAEVDENEDIQHTVLTVTAKDHDECKLICFFFQSLYLITSLEPFSWGDGIFQKCIW